MWRYCIGKIAKNGDQNEPVFFSETAKGVFGWTDCMMGNGVCWYDSVKEARSNLLDEDEFVVSHYFTEADMSDLSSMSICINGFYYDLAQVLAERQPEKVKELAKPKKQTIPTPHNGRGSKYDVMLQKFVRSGANVEEITDFGGVQAGSVARGLSRYIELGDYPVGCVNTFGKVFLVRKGTDEYKLYIEQKPAPRKRKTRNTFIAAMVGAI